MQRKNKDKLKNVQTVHIVNKILRYWPYVEKGNIINIDQMDLM